MIKYQIVSDGIPWQKRLDQLVKSDGQFSPNPNCLSSLRMRAKLEQGVRGMDLISRPCSWHPNEGAVAVVFSGDGVGLDGERTLGDDGVY